MPAVARRGSTGGTAAGFPVRAPPLELPGIATLVAQGMQGGDFQCVGSVLPDACAFASPLDADAVCAYIEQCRGVMVFGNGTDGCSAAQLAVLKRTSLAPSNSFVAPTTYVLEQVVDAQLASTYLYSDEATVLLPAENETSSDGEPGSGELGSTGPWLGCIVARGALLGGEVVATLSGVATPEECCRRCREREAANVWNFCDRLDGCSFSDLRTSFTGGAPLAVTGPEVPGFTRYPASGLFGQQGYSCYGTLKPELAECVLSAPLPDLAAHCETDPLCAAFVFKPAGLFISAASTGYFRETEGANISARILTPSSVLGDSSNLGRLPGSLTTHSGGSSTPSALAASALPASLARWIIARADIQYECRPDGSPVRLGEGASGKVYRAIYRGELVAAKEIQLDRTAAEQDAFIAEALRLQDLRHQHVVQFYGLSVGEAGQGVLLMEYCEGRDLGSALDLQSGAEGSRVFGWYRQGRRVALEVAKALNYLHSRGIVHMSNNVLLTSNLESKLADVGVSRMQSRTFMSDLPALVGTWAYVAPEILMGGVNCSNAVDIYSYGVLLWEIITGQRPARGQLRMPEVEAECPQAAVDLMMECLSLNPADRPPAASVMRRLTALQGRRTSLSL
ncbi:serine threonine-kinase [Micractinium conductrix]|uniref:Serine threonine-kinase n=1 Tax=Micractinium conductrix TaxID=554055 RepID=A0A2P6VI65_9CHLO|nr:serine threonine-kinase [Micractinium conductrix]|eukprot:PSC73768.1 serine threonine-kinase [Micractinium conductrix]